MHRGVDKSRAQQIDPDSLRRQFRRITRGQADAALATYGVSLRAFYEVQRSSTPVGLVAEGVAAAIVPALAIQQGAYPRIKGLPLTEPVISRSLVLVSRKTEQLSQAAQALYDILMEAAKSRSRATSSR
jgi:DNA-binding transcriptional LysR family regulator